MGHIPVRDGAGRIVDMVDADEAAAVAAQETETTEERHEASATAAPHHEPPPLAPDAQRSMEEVLRSVQQRAVPAPSRSWRSVAAETTMGVLLALAMVAILFSRTSSAPSATIPPTALPAQPTSAEQVGATPGEAKPEQPRLHNAVVAYDAPDGLVVGALEPGRPYTLTGRLGTDWLQLDVVHGGLIWVRAGEVERPADVIAVLPDLATPTLEPTAAPPPLPTLPPAPTPLPVQAAPQRCIPDRVVAIVSDGATDVWSCASVADALNTLPGGEVIAADPAAAQAYLARLHADETAIATYTQP